MRKLHLFVLYLEDSQKPPKTLNQPKTQPKLNPNDPETTSENHTRLNRTFIRM